MEEEGFWESVWRRLNEVYGPHGELGASAPIQIGEGSTFGTPAYPEATPGVDVRGTESARMAAIRDNVKRHTFGPESLADTMPSQKKEEEPDDEEDYMNQLLMSALMAGGKATGRQAPSSYGVGAQVPFGDPWVMRRQWEQDYRNIG